MKDAREQAVIGFARIATVSTANGANAGSNRKGNPAARSPGLRSHAKR
jgi:hypothetical protein